MRNFLGRLRRSGSRSLVEQLATLTSVGDGSTLSLDFTTGVLDPRLTFTRDSNATFINSSGLVQWADSNIFYNSTWTDANNTPTAWSAGSGTASRSGETRTFTTSASQVYITQTRNTSSGIRYTASVEVTAVTGTQRIDDVIVALGGSSYQYYFNGSTAGGSTTLTPGVVGVAFTAGAATTTVRIGSGVQGTNTTGAVTLRFPQFEPGSIALRIYRPNDSTTRSYEAPRFDHDPTTGAPRGLLIEGTATNIAFYSQTINPNAAPWNVYWFVAGAGSSVTPVSETDPANTTTASRCVLGASGGRVYNGISTSAGVTYTLSFWAKSVSGPTSLVFWHFNSATGNSTSVTVSTSWQRYQISILGRTGGGFVEFGIANNTGTAATVDFWGLQVETGVGASSYIPTGASQGSRARDEVVLSNLSGISFNQSAGTVYSQLEIVEKLRGSFVPYGSFDTSGGGRCWWWLRHNHDASVGQRILGTAFNSGGSTAITSSNYTHSSGVFKFATSLDPVAGRMVYAIAGGPAQVTNASGFTLATAAQMSLNKNSDVTATDLGSMWVRTIKYWPTALPDAQLQSITT